MIWSLILDIYELDYKYQILVSFLNVEQDLLSLLKIPILN